MICEYFIVVGVRTNEPFMEKSSLVTPKLEEKEQISTNLKHLQNTSTMDTLLYYTPVVGPQKYSSSQVKKCFF